MKLPTELNPIAEQVYAALKRNEAIPDEAMRLYDEDIWKSPPENIDYFAIPLANFEQDFRFCDKELAAHQGLDTLKFSNEQRIKWMRTLIKSTLEAPAEDVPSANWECLELPSGGKLFLCAMVEIEGYDALTTWAGAFLQLEDFYNQLRKSGYVLTSEDVDGIPNEQLLSWWK